MLDRLDAAERRYEQLAEEMARPEVAADYERLQELARERASLEDLVVRFRRLKQIDAGLQEAQAIQREDGDAELSALAQEEADRLMAQRTALLEEIREMLLPRDPRDQKDVIVEIRAGTGGEEAALFAGDLFRMYTRYALARGWHAEVLSQSEAGVGGFKEIVFEVRGKGAFSRLKYERGVHRVQRVPVTESSGRIHTSTATVAVMPEAEEVEFDINPDDLRIDIYHAGGHGGQNVQKVATAVRITHVPTGIVAICQDERSQLRNKNKAMAVLRARLLAQEQERQQAEITAERRSQVGTGERSEKVRTYNFPQNRVTDHRLDVSSYDLPRFLEGGLDEFIDALANHERAQRLQALEAKRSPISR